VYHEGTVCDQCIVGVYAFQEYGIWLIYDQLVLRNNIGPSIYSWDIVLQTIKGWNMKSMNYNLIAIWMTYTTKIV